MNKDEIQTIFIDRDGTIGGIDEVILNQIFVIQESKQLRNIIRCKKEHQKWMI